MADNILESYFVKVGALPDITSFAELGKQLIKTGKSVTNFSETAAKDIFKLDIAAIAAFTAMGVGLVKLADKTAQVDQSYRLLGLRMLMSKESARAMQMALDSLGATIDEVAYDPELNRRFQFLYERNIAMGKQLGQDFDQITERIRDFRMQFKMFSDEVEVGAWASITKLFEKLGFNQDSVLLKLQGINDWVKNRLPGISEEISNRFVPVWNDIESVLVDVEHNLKLLGTDFIQFTGEISGDKSLKQATISFENLAEATQHWVDWLNKAILDLSFIARWAGRPVKGLAMGIKGLWDIGPFGGFDIDAAEGSFKKSGQNFAEWFHDMGYAYFGLPGGEDTKDLEEYHKMIQERSIWKERTSKIVPSQEQLGSIFEGLQKSFSNVPPELIASIMREESGGNIFAQSPTGPKGLMQLSAATAARYGVTDVWDPAQNIRGGTAYLSDLLNLNKGDLLKTILSYHEGEGGMVEWSKMDQILKQLHAEGKEPGTDLDLDRALGAAANLRVRGTFKRAGQIIDAFNDYEDRLRELSTEEREGSLAGGIPASRAASIYAMRVAKDFQTYQQQSKDAGGYSVVINGMNVYVPKALPDDQWGEFLLNKMAEEAAKKTRNTQAQVSSGAFK